MNEGFCFSNLKDPEIFLNTDVCLLFIAVPCCGKYLIF